MSEIGAKRRARKLALQSLYQWYMSGETLSEIERQFRFANNMAKINEDHYCKLLYGVPAHLQEIEAAFSPLLDRPIDTLNPIELTILRICTFELLDCLDIPYRVILDESVSLAKEFGAQEGHRYVNGVLHNLAQKVRRIEVQGR